MNYLHFLHKLKTLLALQANVCVTALPAVVCQTATMKEEADTRIVVHILHARNQNYEECNGTHCKHRYTRKMVPIMGRASS